MPRHVPGAFHDHRLCPSGILLASVGLRHGGGVDDDVGAEVAKQGFDLNGVGDIQCDRGACPEGHEINVAAGHHLVGCGEVPAQRVPEEAARAGDQNPAHGFGFSEPCAMATTVSHYSHQLIVIGTDDSDMAQAANRLAQTGGGQVVVRHGEIIGEVNLPIAGLISNEPAELVARNAETVLAGFRACGCKLNNPNMQMSLLALVVIPELRISDKGLVDVHRFQVIDVLE